MNTDMSLRAAIGSKAADEWRGQLGDEPAGKTGRLIPELPVPFAGAAHNRCLICV